MNSFNIPEGVCPIWGAASFTHRSGAIDFTITSVRCGGSYKIDLLAINQMPMIPEFRAKITTWIVDQIRSGEDCPVVSADLFDQIKQSSPLRLSQRIERFFLYLSSRGFRPGSKLIKGDSTRHYEQIAAWTECHNDADLFGLLDLMFEQGLLHDPRQQVNLTAAGFEFLQKTEVSSPLTRQVFVAMWFGSQMTEAYAQGFAPAIRDAGYDPLRIDQKEHSDKIDDQILMEIRRSRFVVADFTCALIDLPDGKSLADSRGGVYYEAGFAQGLNIPVIWSVRADLIERIHFDTRQFAHITWEDPHDLRERLRNRIGAVIV